MLIAAPVAHLFYIALIVLGFELRPPHGEPISQLTKWSSVRFPPVALTFFFSEKGASPRDPVNVFPVSYPGLTPKAWIDLCNWYLSLAEKMRPVPRPHRRGMQLKYRREGRSLGWAELPPRPQVALGPVRSECPAGLRIPPKGPGRIAP